MIQVILILSNWWPKFWNRRFVFIAASGLGRVLSSSKIENSCPKSGPDLGDTLSLNSLASSFYGMIPHKVFKLVLMLKIIGFIPIATDYTIAMQNLMLQVSYVIIIITRGEGGLWPPSPLVRVAGATLISSEEVVFSEFIQLLCVSSIL